MSARLAQALPVGSGARSEASRGFARTLAFGALAAATLPLSVLALGPWLGAAGARTAHVVLATAGYLAVLAPPGARRRLAVALAAAAAGVFWWGLAGSLASLFAGLSGIVAVFRSGWLFRRGTARAMVVEGGVLLLALATWHGLAGPGLPGQALALWGWFVAQSFYFLPGGLARRRRRPDGDAFERARQRLEELLAS